MNLELLKEPIHPNVKRFIIPLLRKRWLFWPARGEAIKKSRTGTGQYKCNICKRPDFKREDLQVDHIDPVQEIGTKLETWYNLIMFIIRLYVDEDKLQVVCKTCHSLKTQTENNLRRVILKQPSKKKQKRKKSIDK